VSAVPELDVDEALELAARDRDLLLERLRHAARSEVTDTGTIRPVTPAPVAAAPTGPWRVYRQVNHLPERPVCAHRWGWVAELCASRRTTGRSAQPGVFFTARKAGRAES
jgi:hypothetical protein